MASNGTFSKHVIFLSQVSLSIGNAQPSAISQRDSFKIPRTYFYAAPFAAGRRPLPRPVDGQIHWKTDLVEGRPPGVRFNSVISEKLQVSPTLLHSAAYRSLSSVSLDTFFGSLPLRTKPTKFWTCTITSCKWILEPSTTFENDRR